jgi:hypothetical protein
VDRFEIYSAVSTGPTVGTASFQGVRRPAAPSAQQETSEGSENGQLFLLVSLAWQVPLALVVSHSEASTASEEGRSDRTRFGLPVSLLSQVKQVKTRNSASQVKQVPLFML